MAQPLVAGQTIEARFYFTLGTQVAIVVRHYEVASTTGTGGTDEQMAIVLGGVFPGPWKDLIANTARYEGLAVQIVKPVRQLEQVDKTGAGVGVNASDPLPPQTAGRIKLRSALAGRSFRGRMYIPFPSEGQNAATGRPSTQYVTDLNTLIASVVATRTVGTAPNQTTVRPAIYSRKLGTKATLILAVASIFWGTMRRRSFIGRGDLLPI